MALENIDMTKFEKLFSSMEKQLVMQSSFLESIYNLTVDEREDRISRENELDVARVERGKDSSFNGTVEGTPQATEQERTNIFGSIFGLIPKIIAGISLAGIGSLLIGAGFIGLIAPAIGDFVAGFVKQGLEDLEENLGFDIPDSFTTGISEVIGSLATWGLIGKSLGRMFGRRIGMFFMATGFIYTQLQKWLDPDGNNEIDAGFLKGFNTDTLAAIGTALAVALGLILPRLIRKFLPGILWSAMGIPNIMGEDTPKKPQASKGGPARTPVTIQPKARSGIFSGALKAIKGISKSIPAIAGTLAAANEYSESGDVSAAAAVGVGSSVGAIIGAGLGSFFGPVGTFVGGIGGSIAGEYVGKAFDDMASMTTEESGGTSPAEQPNRRTALENQRKIDADAEIARLKASGLYGDFVPPPVSTTPAEMAIPGVSFGPNGEIIRPKLNTITPVSPTQPKLEKLEQLSQKLLEQGKSASMNSFSSPTTIGGATTINNTNSTVIMTADAGRSLDSFVLA